MPAPALPVVGRGEQAVHGLFVRGGRAVGEETLNLFGSGRQTREVQAEPAQECVAVSFRRRLDILALQTRQDETVDRSPHPPGLLHRGGLGALRGLERPVVPTRTLFRHRGFRPDSVLLDPLPQSRDLLVLETACGRHFQIAALLDRLNEQAFGRRAGLDGRAAVASGEHAFAAVQGKAAAAIAQIVAGQAVRFQDGLDAVFEEGAGILLSGQRRRGNDQEGKRRILSRNDGTHLS